MIFLVKPIALTLYVTSLVVTALGINFSFRSEKINSLIHLAIWSGAFFYALFWAMAHFPNYFIGGIIIVAGGIQLHKNYTGDDKNTYDCGYFVSVFTSIVFVMPLMWWLYDSGTLSWKNQAGSPGSPVISLISNDIFYCYLFLSILSGLLFLERSDLFNLRKPLLDRLIFVSFVFCVACSCFGTTGLGPWGASHNWSAYIGPARLLAAGVIPFDGLPLQYGFGPTALVAASCSSNCWTGFWILSAGLSFLSLSLMGYMGFRLLEREKTTTKFCLLASVFFVGCFWVGWLPNAFNVNVIPSAGGMRFFPGVLFVFYLFMFLEKQAKGLGSAIPKWGHSLWLASFFWSPEAAIQVSFVWIPFYVFACRDATKALTSQLIRKSLTLLIVFLSALGSIWLLYKFGFNLDFSIKTYLAYILNPPGAMPHKADGVILFLGYVILLHWLEAITSQNRESKKINYILILFALAASSYFFGRSHENNMLNVLPYLLISIIGLFSKAQSKQIRIACLTIALSLVALTFTLISGKSLLMRTFSENSFGLSMVASAFDPQSGYMAKRISRDYEGRPDGQHSYAELVTVLKKIDNDYGEPVEIHIVTNLRLDGSESHLPWNALHSVLNWFYLPKPIVEKAVADVAEQLKSNGWYVFSTTNNGHYQLYLELFDRYYERDVEIVVKDLHAIRFISKRKLTYNVGD